MRVKKYIVDTMPEAMSLIRSELGSDAVILSTKSIKTGGFAGLFRKQKIEVVAAVEEPAASVSAVNLQASPPAAQAQPRPIPRAMAPDAYRKVADGMNNGEQAPAKEKQEDVKQENPSYRGPRSSVLPSIPVQEPHPGGADFSASTDQALLTEIQQLKQMMTSFTKRDAYEAMLPGNLNEARARLVQQGVIDELWMKWIDAAQEQWSEQTEQSGFALVKEEIREFLVERIDAGIAQDTRIVYVAGPTGVGKTTTIAKLAAEQMFKYKRKVGFVTADTYRISAVEQLRTYAAILGVPLEVVQSPADTKRALERLADCDLIFMDTAGRNYRNEMLVSELNSLLLDEPNSEMMLVLSLTSKTEDMLVILDHFTKYGLSKVIFTKMDETDSLGSIINVLYRYPVTLSYIADGQNVPDDLMVPDAKTLSDCIMGSDENE